MWNFLKLISDSLSDSLKKLVFIILRFVIIGTFKYTKLGRKVVKCLICLIKEIKILLRKIKREISPLFCNLRDWTILVLVVYATYFLVKLTILIFWILKVECIPLCTWILLLSRFIRLILILGIFFIYCLMSVFFIIWKVVFEYITDNLFYSLFITFIVWMKYWSILLYIF